MVGKVLKVSMDSVAYNVIELSETDISYTTFNRHRGWRLVAYSVGCTHGYSH
jgi:hypothetical protein